MPFLMALPIETRLTIFRYAIPEQVVHEMPSDEMASNEPLPVNPSLSLLLTSSTINAEVCILPKPILTARFSILSAASVKRFYDWLELPRGQRIIKVQRIELSYEYDINLHGRLEEDIRSFLARNNSTEFGDPWGPEVEERLSKGFQQVELLIVKRTAQLDKDIAHAKIVLLWKVA